jgi:ATP-dependent helicase/nuclease subunit A
VTDTLLDTDFSREQAQALILEHHVIVSAAAGSGKTRVLVERYVRMLLTGVMPPEIVAITFTRKAAAEMLTRIRKRVDELLASTDVLSDTEREHLQAARLRLSSHRVSTIHSFCAAVLREFAIEAEIPPAFSDLDRSDAQRIMDSAIDDVVRAWWKDDLRTNTVQDLFFDMEPRSVLATLALLANDALKLERLRAVYVKNNEEILDVVSQVYARSMFREQEGMVGEIRQAVSRVDESALKEKARDFVHEVRVFCDAFQDRAQGTEDSGYAYTVIDVISRSLGDVPRKSATMSDELKTVIDSIRKLKKSAEKFGPRMKEADLRMMAHARTLVAMATEVVAKADERKREMQQLDFDDLQREALRVLSDPAICHEVRRSMKCIMIDEFQDTNDVQFDLLKKLVPDPKTDESASGAPDITVFLVGDVKQSIYGFRDADVRVFEKAEEYVQRLNMRKHGTAGLGRVRLTASYRMASGVADAVNAMCHPVFSASSGEFDVTYDPLVCARDLSTFPASTCELLLGTGAKATDVADSIPQELLVADAIRRMVDDDGTMVWDEDAKMLRRAVYSDIAVLSRTTKSLSTLEGALMQSGIPCLRHSGSGFYATQEVKDALSFLAFVLDTSDDAALVAVLRSPLFAVTEQTILNNKRIRDGHVLWDTLRNRYLAKDGERVESDLRSAVIILDAMVTLGPATRPSDLLRDVLLRSAWYARVDYMEHRAEQARRNMEKLITELISIEAAGFRHLVEVVEELQLRTTAENKEPEAAVMSGENVVNLMTIHASKGLEFPIVIIHDVGNKGRTIADEAIIHDELGVCYSLRVRLKDERVGLMRALAVDWLQRRQDAELKRILYVAMTRAKDHLLLSCNAASKDSKESFPRSGMGKLLHDVMSDRCVEGQPTLLPVMRNTREADGASTEERILVTIPTRRNIIESGDGAPAATSARKDAPAVRVDIGSIAHASHGEVYSATQLMVFHADPAGYYLRYRLGYVTEEDGFDEIPVSDSAPGHLGAIELGTVVHEVLAELPRWWSDGGAHESACRDSVIRTLCQRRGIDCTDKLMKKVHDHCGTVAAYLRTRSLDAGAIHHAEYALTVPVGTDFCTGKIDAVVHTDGGPISTARHLEVWDWKTNHLQGKSPDHLAKRYEVQMRLYCYLVMLSYPEIETCAARLLFTETGETRTLELRRGDVVDTRAWLEESIATMKRL